MKYDYLNIIDEQADFIDKLADDLWDHPELAFDEYESVEILIKALKTAGFEVQEKLADIDTAFSGRFGSGKPVIGILGEFDALSGLGQVSGRTCKQNDGHDNGHGCGHNLLGAGSFAAAMAVKKYLGDKPGQGTVIYFGCPGEEGGSGKAFMARDGVFDELDCAFCWHPDEITYVRTNSSLANCQVRYLFDGKAAHAGGAPELGRSALDAVELMNVGVNFLREHMIDDARIHYAITDAGGISPNVVQPHAEVLYLIRAPKNDQVVSLHERVLKIAKGAAMMTETEVQEVFIKACSNTIVNQAMSKMMQKKMEEIPVPEPTEEDIAFCKELSDKALIDYPKYDAINPLHWQLSPYQEGKQEHGSTDVGDVSWVCPTAQISTATEAFGTPGHSWQETAQGKLPLAHKMMRYAGKIMAASAVEMLENKDLMQKAKDEHRLSVGKDGYIPPIPKGVKPTKLNSLGKR